MSTSTYYNFVCSPGDQDKRPLARTVQDMGQLEQRRQTAISPDSFVTSSSDSSSSLNSQFNSYTPNSIRSTSTSCSTASTFSNSFNSSCSPKLTIDTTTTTNPKHAPAYLANSSPQPTSSSVKSSTPSSSHMPSQMIHSYTLNSLEPRPLKPFKSRSAYIDAMKEDLAEWLNSIYSDLELTPDNFFSHLETGAIICRHANNVTQMGRNLMMEQSTTSSDGGSGSDNENNSLNRDSSLSSHHQNNSLNSLSPVNGVEREHQSQTNIDSNLNSSRNISQFIHRHRNSTTNSSTSSISTTTSSSASRQRLSLTGPILPSMCSPRSMADRGIDWFRVKVISYKSDARPGTFFARDNICQFILWCRSLRILECLLFETDDLVSRKNEKSFILCLLEVARIGFKVGMPTPLIIQLEQEIDREIEKDAKLQKQLEDGHARDVQSEKQQQKLVDRDLADFLNDKDHYEASNDNDNNTNDGLAMQKQQTAELNNNHGDNKREDTQAETDKPLDDAATIAAQESEEEEEFSEDFGPKPQLVLNDLMNLHERVVQLLCQCTCPTQFPMVRIGDGKYKVGDKLIIFVRILRRHIMVRVGGGWQELSEFLRQKDPCRTKQQQQGFFNQHLQQQQQQHQHSTSRTPTQTTCCIPVSRSRLVGSSHQLNKSYHGNRGPGGSSGSITASMSWLSHN